VPTLTGRGLFVLIVLTHTRRRVAHFNITEHPTAAWTAQQVVEAFREDTAPRWLLRDRDRAYGEVFRPTDSERQRAFTDIHRSSERCCAFPI
jgi:putative transposase